MMEKEQNWKKKGKKGNERQNKQMNRGSELRRLEKNFFREAKLAHVLQPWDSVLNRYWQQFRCFLLNCVQTLQWHHTGLFISPSGISELECATTKTDTAERSISISRESLQVFFCTRGFGVFPGSTARG